MVERKANLWLVLLGIVGLGLAAWLAISTPGGTALAASGGTITGVVTDAGGKPLRGAVVTATIQNPTPTVRSMSVARWSDASGKYRIAGLKPGNYSVSARAYAYAPSSPVNKAIGAGATGDLSFRLKAHWDPTQISTSEYISAFGHQHSIRVVEGNCTSCHNFSWIMRIPGMTAEQWASFIPKMPAPAMNPLHLKTGRRGEGEALGLSLKTLPTISADVAKYFGPHSALPTKADVVHVPISSAVLNQTMVYYTPPTTNIAHSLSVGADGRVWFSEWDLQSSKVGMFDPSTASFKEYTPPTPRSMPHNTWVARNGMVWFAEYNASKLASIDPKTGKISEYPVPDNCGAHSLEEGPTGDIWGTAPNRCVSRFDPKTKKFTTYPAATGYMLAVDSRNHAWSTDFGRGTIDEVDPKTGKITRHPVPDAVRGIISLRGIAVDTHDNVWFADLLGPNGHSLVRIDHRSKKMTFYRPPTPNFSGYGIWVNQKTGNLWLADYLGASVDRFDPATRKWTVFPFPSERQMIRFFSQDPQGRVWFTDFTNGRIGCLQTGETGSVACPQ